MYNNSEKKIWIEVGFIENKIILIIILIYIYNILWIILLLRKNVKWNGNLPILIFEMKDNKWTNLCDIF